MKPKTLLAFAVDDLIDGLAVLDDGWLDEHERAGMRQAAIAVINTALVAAARPDRPPVVQAAYAAVLAFSYALGRAADAKRADPVAIETCREGLTEMLDALSPYLADGGNEADHHPGGRCAIGESGATTELVARSSGVGAA